MSFNEICQYDISMLSYILKLMKPEHVQPSPGVLSEVEKIDIIRLGVLSKYTHVYITFVDKVINMLENNIGQGSCPLAILLTIPPGKGIPLHTDKGETNKLAKRYHLPLSTNPNVVTSIGSFKGCMLPGCMYELDTFNLSHGTVNNGNEPRTHLIVDWIKSV